MIRACLIVWAMLISVTQPAVAADFCLAGPGLSPQCIYDDISVCRRASEPPTTDCFVNDSALLIQQGNAEYCLVTSQRISECIYTDRGQCNTAARSRSGVCKTNNTNEAPENPYRYDTRVQ